MVSVQGKMAALFVLQTLMHLMAVVYVNIISIVIIYLVIFPPRFPFPTHKMTDQSEAAIKTLFVAGLPYDATDRELYLVFGITKGYDKSMIVRKENGKRPYGFVNYNTQLDAENAKNAVNGFQWDPSDPIKLKIELSKRNTPDWFTAQCSPAGSAEIRKMEVLARQPKTLFVTSLPATVGKDLFKALVVANFADQVVGLRYTPQMRNKPAFAFVGFQDHMQAKTAMERLEGYVWNHEGVSSAIHASFANTEFNITAENTEPGDVVQPGYAPASRTVHLSRLPHSCTKETLEAQFEALFPQQVEAMRFSQKDGKPPFAFILFRTPEVASEAIKRYNGSEWEGSVLKASQARTELDITKLGTSA